MRTNPTVVLCVGIALVFGAGCASTRTSQQFDPVPRIDVAEEQLAPVDTRTPLELLQAAGEALREGNAAQERGDAAAAKQHYTRMFELILEADVDPAILYGNRLDVAKMLDATTQQALIQERLGKVGESPGELFRMYGDLPLPFPVPERVNWEVQDIRESYRRNFQYGLNRSSKYLPYIRAEFAKAGLPQDLVWLAMVESQFAPWVTSPAGAAGMWQFMRTTGTRYGLKIDSYVDERYNWQKATHAAIGYLGELRDYFGGNWPVAVASYNSGEGGMGRAIASAGGESDIWRLLDTSSSLKEETKKFYPKLLASVLVATSPDKYGLTLDPQAPDDVVYVKVDKIYSLAALDRACGLEEGTLKSLNYELYKGVTPPYEHPVAVPRASESQFMAALQKVSAESASRAVSSSGSAPSSGGTHTVRRGETLSSIARKYNVALADLQRANDIGSAHRLQAGKRLVIPGRGGSASAASSSSAGAAKTSSNVSPQAADYYTVRRGDTLSEIASRQRVSISDLRDWNKLGRSSSIRTGQRLVIRPASAAPEVESKAETAPAPEANEAAAAEAAEASPVSPSGEKRTHKVAAGEFPAKVAKAYGVSVDDLLSWNGLGKNGTIYVGQELVVYANGGPAPSSKSSSAASAPAPKASSHTVGKGETVSTIASKYGLSTSDVLKANNLTSKSVIRIGQKLTIPSKGSSAASAQPEKVTHTVSKGETPGGIASKYGVKLSEMTSWNGWKKDHVLQIGEKVVILKK